MSENGIRDARTLGMPRMLLLGLQHMFAMFGATVLVPVLTGLPVATTLLFAGLGTLLFHFLTKRKVPAFLGSSFAFLGGYAGVEALFHDTGVNWIPYAGAAVGLAGLTYVALAALFKAFGARRVMRFFPPIVTGPVIICIGLCLANSAINNCVTNWWIALAAIVIVVVCNIWGKGMIKIIPILLGIVGSYVLAAVFGQVDFSAVRTAPWLGHAINPDNTVLAMRNGLDVPKLISAYVIMVPISLATMIEHVGDICAISSTVDQNFVADPGLHRTLLGDGLATSLAAMFGAPANTTYGENTGVLALTKVYDPEVIRMAAAFAMLLSCCPKFSALISCMPAATIGGVSLILYGMISAVGVRNVVENQVDFTKSRNIIIAALIMGLSLGINFSAAGAIVLGPVSLSGLAVGALVGILLNAVLPGNDYEFGNDLQGDTAVNFQQGVDRVTDHKKKKK